MKKFLFVVFLFFAFLSSGSAQENGYLNFQWYRGIYDYSNLSPENHTGNQSLGLTDIYADDDGLNIFVEYYFDAIDRNIVVKAGRDVYPLYFTDEFGTPSYAYLFIPWSKIPFGTWITIDAYATPLISEYAEYGYYQPVNLGASFYIY